MWCLFCPLSATYFLLTDTENSSIFWLHSCGCVRHATGYFQSFEGVSFLRIIDQQIQNRTPVSKNGLSKYPLFRGAALIQLKRGVDEGAWFAMLSADSIEKLFCSFKNQNRPCSD
jgi:hypothetical protein